ncbi:MAG: translation initiation factor IF-2 [Patescibacteria group bacterium]|nr:translation initiation factor IF-2 [Patescibacteria group bacterium]MDD5491013.1 translation initiation factor IF-2 [Patescibacteria group bacterium]
MNVTELARKLKVTTEDLLNILPQIGFDIGQKAIKVDDRTAERIIREWPMKMRELKKRLDESAVGEEGAEEKEAEIKEVKIPPVIIVKDFAQRLGLPVTQVLMELMKSGILSAQNEKIDFSTATIVAEDLGYQTVPEGSSEEEIKISDKISELLKDEKDLEYRAPVIVVMGHVDHGKTKLLDAIRKTNVMESEAGGITQHIGAYQVQKNGRALTFIDTPGHEAFSAMRSRGAKIADIAILVVAADDGVKPQTREAVDIIKAAKLPLIVAINKIDKEGVNIDKVKSDLAEIGLTPEDWGGKTICAPISAKQNIGIDELLEVLLLVADMEKENIKANPAGKPVGVIVESHIDAGEGPVATLLVKNGVFKAGHFLGVDNFLYGKVRSMKNWKGEQVMKAGPSMPVKILGFKMAPFVGDVVEGRENDKGLERDWKSKRANEEVSVMVGQKKKASAKDLNIILKADVLGSLEAIVASIEKISHPDLSINIVGKGLGNITDSDTMEAEASNAEIIGFHVGANQGVETVAQEKKVAIKYYSIIYKLLEELKAELEGLLEAQIIRHVTGKLRIIALFKSAKDTMIVGGKITEGKIFNGSKFSIWRGNNKVGAGAIKELQSAKMAVNEAVEGEECGINVKTDTAIAVGDILECYTEEKKEQKIN